MIKIILFLYIDQIKISHLL